MKEPDFVMETVQKIEAVQWLSDVENYYKKMEIDLQDLFSAYSDQSRCQGSGGFSVYSLLKWIKQGGLMKKNLTSTDIFINFCKLSKSKRTIEFHEFLEVVKLLAIKGGMSYPDFLRRLMDAGYPRPTRNTISEDCPVVNRLLSTSRSTTSFRRNSRSPKMQMADGTDSKGTRVGTSISAHESEQETPGHAPSRCNSSRIPTPTTLMKATNAAGKGGSRPASRSRSPGRGGGVGGGGARSTPNSPAAVNLADTGEVPNVEIQDPRVAVRDLIMEHFGQNLQGEQEGIAITAAATAAVGAATAKARRS